jgi:hypothetical protein
MQQDHENTQDSNESKQATVISNKELSGKSISFSDIREHISGPVISIILHVILIIFLTFIIVIDKPEEDPSKDPDITITDIKVPKIKKMQKIPNPEKTENKLEMKIDRPEIEIKAIDLDVDKITFKKSIIPVRIPNFNDVKPAGTNNTLPPGMDNRKPELIDVKLVEYDAPPGTEDAVLRGLHWLKDNQNPDGSWGDSAKKNYAAYTGMALLAFLAHGETPTSKEFGPTVDKAIKKLVEMVGPEADKVPGGYRHGIAMYALTEAYALTRITMLKSVVDKGISRIIKGMNSQGSFDYGYKLGGRSDLSVAGWNYQALKAAFAAGCEVEGLEEAIDRAVNLGLKKTHYDSGKQMFCYGAGSGAKSTMTAVGVLCLQLFGEGKSREAKGGLEVLKSPDYFWMDWKGKGQKGNIGWDLYQWYYQTQAIFQGTGGKGRTWKAWNKMFASHLMKQQKSDGRWETPAFENNPAKKGHDEAMLKGLDQPVYATSLCCMMLEVYYRYLPTFKVAKVVIEKDTEEDNRDDDFGLSLE